MASLALGLTYSNQRESFICSYSKQQKQEQTFKGFFSLLTPAPHPDLIDFLKEHSPSIMQGGWEDMKFAILYRCITLMTGGRGWSSPPSAWDVQAWQACLTEKLLDISQRGSILVEGPGVCYYIILVCSLGSHFGPINI